MPLTSLVAGVCEGEDEQATATKSQAACAIDQDGEYLTHAAYSAVFSRSRRSEPCVSVVTPEHLHGSPTRRIN